MIENLFLELLIICKYLLFSRFVWQENFLLKQRKNFICIIPIVLLIFFSTDIHKDISLIVVQYIVMTSIIVIVQTTSWINSIKEIVVSFFLFYLLETGTGAIITLLFGMNRAWQISDIAVNLLSIIILLTIFGITRIFHRKLQLSIDGLSFIQWSLIVLLLCMISISFNYIIQYICRFRPDKLNACIAIGAVLIAGWSTIIFLYMSFRIANSKKISETQLALESTFNTQQADYFKMMLSRENETQNFRHDINNQLYTLSILLRDNKIQESKDFLEEVSGSFNEISHMNYETGDEIINILLNYYLDKIKKEAGVCEIKLKGRLMSPLNADRLDICTIFSNILQNIYEELIRINKEQMKYCSIKIRSGNIFSSIVFENSTVGNLTDLKTKKDDKYLHGRGLGNVKKSMERIHGEINISSTDGVFRTEIIIPIQK